jgi:hypothetical protein
LNGTGSGIVMMLDLVLRNHHEITVMERDNPTRLFRLSDPEEGDVTTHETGQDVSSSEGTVTVTETGTGTYTQEITAGRHRLVSDERARLVKTPGRRRTICSLPGSGRVHP